MNKPFIHTRIVCTIGPASQSVQILKKMINAGMNVCRLNFSHGTYSDHRRLIKNIHKASKETGVLVSILQDLSGPKLRVGDLGEKGILLKKNSSVTISSCGVFPHVIPVSYAHFERDVEKGNRILLDDGLLELEVTGKTSSGVRCKVIVGGVLKSHKGLNLPSTKLSISSVTEKDKKDVLFGLENEVDFIALSFVRSANDIKELRKIIKHHWNNKKGQMPKIVAKIEKQEALNNLESILQETDAIMIARGDLGIETPMADVPLHQKRIISRSRELGKPVIVATEMLGSMMAKPRPTRAEVSDVANAVIDHSDAIMLSGESATGDFPVEAVSTMALIANEAEQSIFDDVMLCQTADATHKTSRDAGALTSVLSTRGDIKAIILPPSAITFVSQVSYFRPTVPMFICTLTPREARQIQLFWGSHVIISTRDNFYKTLTNLAKKISLKKSDQVAVLTKNWRGFRVAVCPFSEWLK